MVHHAQDREEVGVNFGWRKFYQIFGVETNPLSWVIDIPHLSAFEGCSTTLGC